MRIVDQFRTIMEAEGRIKRSTLFQPGQSFGKFYLVQLLGEGGTSSIFKAIQQPIDRIVALKIPSFSGGGKLLSPDEFLSEATLMAKLDHSNVVRILDFGILKRDPPANRVGKRRLAAKYFSRFSWQNRGNQKGGWGIIVYAAITR